MFPWSMPLEGELEVADVEDDRTGESHVFAPGCHFRVVDVVEVVSGHPVVLHDEAGLAAREEKLDTLVLVFGVAVTGELEDPPRLGSIHLRVGAAEEWRGARARGRRLALRRRDVLGAVDRA